MNALNLLLIFVVLTVGANAGTEPRQGRCGSKPGKAGFVKAKGNARKPIALHGGGGHVFNGKGTSIDTAKLPPGATVIVSSASNEHLQKNVNSGIGNYNNNKDTLPNPYQTQQVSSSDDELGSAYGQDSGFAPRLEIPGKGKNVGSSGRLQISENGDVTFARSLNFDNHWHFHDYDELDPDHDHDHHMDEDSVHFHKLRMARAIPVLRDSRPQQLADTLAALNTNVQNGASASDNFQMTASGADITTGTSGSSNVGGSGTVSSTGHTTINSSGSSSGGWKRPS